MSQMRSMVYSPSFEPPEQKYQPSRGFPLPSPSSSIYEERRDSTMSDLNSDSYGRSFSRAPSGTSSKYCSPRLPQTPTHGRAILSDSAILDTAQQVAESGYIDMFPDTSRAGNAWAHMTRGEVQLPRIAATQTPSMISDGSDIKNHFNVSVPHKSDQYALVPANGSYSSSGDWTSPASSSHTIGDDAYYTPYPGISRFESVSHCAWSQGLPPAQSYVESFEEQAVTNGPVFSQDRYVRSPSGHNADFDGRVYSSYPPAHSPLPPMAQSAGRRYRPLPSMSFDHHASRLQGRPARAITSKGIKRERSGAGVVKRTVRVGKADVGYIHAPDGARIPVKLQGEFKKDQNGKWTGMGTDGQKHRCEMMRAGEKCSRTFKRIEHLRRHMRTHTQEQPFACEFPTEKVENGMHRWVGCGKLFQRNDNCVAHFKTHVSQDRHGLYFPAFISTKEEIESSSNEFLVGLAHDVESNIPKNDRKKGSRNPRVAWEEFLVRLKTIKTPDEATKIVASVFKSCLKDDDKTRTGR